MASNNKNAQNQNEQPSGWVWTKLKDVALINYRDPGIGDLPDELRVSFVPMASVDAEKGIIAKPETRTLSEVKRGYTPFSNGDVLFAKITPSMENGKAAIAKDLINGLGFGSTEFHVLTPKDGVLAEWLFYFVRQEKFRQDAKAKFAGTAGQLRVPKGFLENYDIPLAPFREQKRIVEKIEELVTQLYVALADLKRVQANLARYKASVLKAACEGRLVTTEAELARAEGREYERVEELLQRILEERKKKWEEEQKAKGKEPGKLKYKKPEPPDTDGLPELPVGWVWATVEQLGATNEQPVLTGPFGSNLGSDDFVESGVPVLTIGSLTEQGLDLGKAKYISESKASELHRYRVRKGDLLFSRMATVGRAGLVTTQHEGTIINYHLMRLRLSRQAIEPTYFITYVRGSDTVTDYVREVNHGATRDGINTTQLLSMPVALPPVAEQIRIIEEVERKLSVIQEMEATVEANLKRAERLRQAILRRAFEGRLVPQDPVEEPGTVLLERMRSNKTEGKQLEMFSP